MIILFVVEMECRCKLVDDSYTCAVVWGSFVVDDLFFNFSLSCCIMIAAIGKPKRQPSRWQPGRSK